MYKLELVNEIASSLVGIPFLKGGRDPKVGLDCYGLCKTLCLHLGVELPEQESPEEREDIDAVVQGEKEHFVKLTSIEPLAIVVFAIRPPYESHVGIVLPDRRRFIHTSRSVGCSIEKLDAPFWAKRVRGFYKWTP